MNDEKLIRGIGRWDLIAIVINTIIGAGIFGLPSKVAALIGSYSLVAFGICAVIIALIVLCFAEVSSRFRSTGGAYAYARSAYGRVIGFETGWLFWITRLTAFAANCNLLVSYLGFFYEPLDTGALRVFMIGLIVVGLAWVNIAGVRDSVTLTNVLTIGKLVPLVLFVLVGLFFIDTGNFDFSSSPEADVFANAILVTIYAFVGFESAVIPAGEMRDPNRNAPISLMAAVGFIVAIYILIQTVAIGTLPQLAASERPLADAAVLFVGPAGAVVIVVGAAISILGNLNVGLLASTRLLFAMSDEGDVPKILARTHERYRTPHVSVAVSSAVIFLFTAFSTFVSALTLSTLTRLIVFVLTCISLPVFRYRDKDGHPGFKVPFGNLVAFLSVVAIAWLFYYVKLAEFLQLLAAAAVGLVIFFGYSLLKRE